MRWILGLAMVGLLLPMQGFSKSPEEVATSQKAVVVEFVTSMGNIRVQTLPTKAPKTVANFLKYVRDGFYNDTVFHRVIPRFMVQGGGMGPDMVRKKTRSPIPNEAYRSISNQRGTLSMARTGAPHSATAQFFINTVANRFLDHRSKTPSGWGYCVFAKVIEGMDIVDKISKVSTTTRNGHRNVPVDPVWLKRAYVVK